MCSLEASCVRNPASWSMGEVPVRHGRTKDGPARHVLQLSTGRMDQKDGRGGHPHAHPGVCLERRDPIPEIAEHQASVHRSGLCARSSAHLCCRPRRSRRRRRRRRRRRLEASLSASPDASTLLSVYTPDAKTLEEWINVRVITAI
jgi:hypothetical protein